jgi:hypothetical protein
MHTGLNDTEVHLIERDGYKLMYAIKYVIDA